MDAKIENENILIAPTEEKKIDDFESTITEESLSKEEIIMYKSCLLKFCAKQYKLKNNNIIFYNRFKMIEIMNNLF